MRAILRIKQKSHFNNIDYIIRFMLKRNRCTLTNNEQLSIRTELPEEVVLQSSAELEPSYRTATTFVKTLGFGLLTDIVPLG